MKRTVVTMVAVLAIVGVAQGQLVDNFDSYANQAAFDAAWSPAVGGGGALSSAQVVSAPNAIYIDTAAHRSDTTFAAVVGTDANPVEWKFDFYDTTGTGHARQYVQLWDNDAGLAQLMSFGTYNNSGTVAEMSTYYSARVAFGSDAWFVLDDVGVVERSVGWHEMKALIKSTTVEFYVDGTLGHTAPIGGAGGFSWDTARIGSGLSSANGDAYYDNLSISVVPEPASLMLLTIGGLFLRRRRA